MNSRPWNVFILVYFLSLQIILKLNMDYITLIYAWLQNCLSDDIHTFVVVLSLRTWDVSEAIRCARSGSTACL